jgi:hypothetical protein
MFSAVDLDGTLRQTRSTSLFRGYSHTPDAYGSTPDTVIVRYSGVNGKPLSKEVVSTHMVVRRAMDRDREHRDAPRGMTE